MAQDDGSEPGLFARVWAAARTPFPYRYSRLLLFLFPVPTLLALSFSSSPSPFFSSSSLPFSILLLLYLLLAIARATPPASPISVFSTSPPPLLSPFPPLLWLVLRLLPLPYRYSRPLLLLFSPLFLLSTLSSSSLPFSSSFRSSYASFLSHIGILDLSSSSSLPFSSSPPSPPLLSSPLPPLHLLLFSPSPPLLLLFSPFLFLLSSLARPTPPSSDLSSSSLSPFLSPLFFLPFARPTPPSSVPSACSSRPVRAISASDFRHQHAMNLITGTFSCLLPRGFQTFLAVLGQLQKSDTSTRKLFSAERVHNPKGDAHSLPPETERRSESPGRNRAWNQNLKDWFVRMKSRNYTPPPRSTCGSTGSHRQERLKQNTEMTNRQ
ncbi:hypothetical protein C7M84_015290 [Penaeus vannamei]|uniref:Uncharacterized protein n=1 Tax=Penaeus vannamei TaxID=6689 RepID=A0A3R7SM47_PENVA|nr:hypothetical protein C7M84_015290 [Penaeus vannamei]